MKKMYSEEDKEYFEWVFEKKKEQTEKRDLEYWKLPYICGEATSPEILSKRAKAHPDRTAINFYGRAVTYKDLDDQSNQFANLLKDKGLGKDDFIGVHLYNCPQYFIAHYGALKAGCVVVPMDPEWEKYELEPVFDDTEMNLIVTQDLNYDAVEETREGTQLEDIYTTSSLDFLPEDPAYPFPEELKGKPDFTGGIDLMSSIKKYSTSSPDVEITLDDGASLDYTGGTTGLPKGCLHKHRGVIYTLACLNHYHGIKDYNALVFVPVFHTAGKGFIESVLYSGGKVILLAQFEPMAFFEASKKYEAEVTWGPSDLYEKFAKMPSEDLEQFDLSSYELLTCTQYNVPLTKEARETWEEITDGAKLYDNSYGLTETMSMNTWNRGLQDIDLDKQEEHGHTFVGLPAPETYIKIVDPETHETLEPGTVGEIAIKDPALPPEYFKRPEETEEDYLDDGFLLTGDLGMYDEDGFLYFAGRRKYTLKVSGFTVSPAEIGNILMQHPAIEKASVVGRDHDKKGEVPVAFVEINPEYEESITEEELIEWSEENISGYKVPARIVFKEEIPTGKKGLKTDREALKDEAKEID